MFKLAKFIIVVAAIAGMAYFVFFVSLGDRTFYEHLVNISETDEAKDLSKELKEKALDTQKKVSSELKKEISEIAQSKKELAKEAAGEAVHKIEIMSVEHSKEDRQALNELIVKKRGRSGGNLKAQ